MNVFDGIDFQKLSDEEAVEMLKQIKTAQVKLSRYDVKPNYRKGDLLNLVLETSTLSTLATKHGRTGRYFLGMRVEDAILEIADYCTNNYATTSTGRKRKNTLVGYEKKDQYINVMSDVLEVICKYFSTMEDQDEAVRQEGKKENPS